VDTVLVRNFWCRYGVTYFIFLKNLRNNPFEDGFHFFTGIIINHHQMASGNVTVKLGKKQECLLYIEDVSEKQLHIITFNVLFCEKVNVHFFLNINSKISFVV